MTYLVLAALVLGPLILCFVFFVTLVIVVAANKRVEQTAIISLSLALSAGEEEEEEVAILLFNLCRCCCRMNITYARAFLTFPFFTASFFVQQHFAFFSLLLLLLLLY